MNHGKTLMLGKAAACILLASTTAFAGGLPLEFSTIPVIANMVNRSTQIVTFTLHNKTGVALPLVIGGIVPPVSVSAVTQNNDCTSILPAGQSCNLRLSIRPTTPGTINQTLSIDYHGRYPLTAPINLTVSSALAQSARLSPSVFHSSAFVGVDYAPGHYPQGDPRNDEDEANVVPEFKQLQLAGFNTVRMYEEPGKTWIAAINAANNQGMQVIYQLGTCQSDPVTHNCINGPGTFASVLATEITRLQGVINQVGSATFQKVVPLILIGNEIYITNSQDQSNLSDLLSAVTQVRAIADPLSIPTSISLQGDVWITTDKKIQSDLNTLVNALSTNAPIGVNIYPFQWVVPVAQSVNTSTLHSINWYLSGLNYPNNPLFISETGWATAGNYKVGSNVTTGDINTSETYFPLLYAYTANKYSTLAFMGFDTPTKTTDPNLTSENFYGVFDDKCNLKGGSAPLNLLPNTSYNGSPQCSDSNAIFTFAGGSSNAQPPFSIQYVHGGLTYVVNVPTADRTNQDLTPWPTITLSAGDTVTLVSTSSSCTNTVATINSSHSGGTWTSTSGTGSGNCSGVNWANGQTVFMPNPY